MTTRTDPTATTAAVAPTPADRVVWADVAKGACIVLVVLWHVVVKDYLQIDWRVGLPVPGAWGLFGEQLLPLRMPLFFTISGIFAANAVTRPWRVAGRPRVARLLYLYAVWLLIHTAVLALAPGFPTDRATSAGGLLIQLTVTPSNLWYLYALALYFVLATPSGGPALGWWCPSPRWRSASPRRPGSPGGGWSAGRSPPSAAGRCRSTSSTCRCWRCCTGCSPAPSPS